MGHGHQRSDHGCFMMMVVLVLMVDDGAGLMMGSTRSGIMLQLGEQHELRILMMWQLRCAVGRQIVLLHCVVQTTVIPVLLYNIPMPWRCSRRCWFLSGKRAPGHPLELLLVACWLVNFYTLFSYSLQLRTVP